MTMVSFRLSSSEAGEVERWAGRIGVARSDLLREALREHLVRLVAEDEASKTDSISPIEGADDLAAASDWGESEDWADWR